MLFLNNADVEKLLDMKTCLEALEVGYQDLVTGNAVHRPRIDVWAPCERDDGYFRWGSMEGVCRSYGVFAIRMKSDVVCWPEGENEIKYCIQPGTFCGLIMLFSTKNGEPLAIINDGVVQHMRVGACAGLGVKYLAREDANIVGIIGSGVWRALISGPLLRFGR
jgi:alanine dehydrogenase